jgi:type III secretory pathway component EscT
VSGARGQYFLLFRRAITGLILGTIAGAVQVWFFKQGIMHLWAAMAAGVLYMTTWALFTDWLQLAGGKILLGAVAGLLAGIAWWAIAIHADNVFVSAAFAGLCFGAAYAWSDQRMT